LQKSNKRKESDNDISRKLERSDIESLISLVGRRGAIAAIAESDKYPVHVLTDFAISLGIEAKAKMSKKMIASKIVHNIDPRIRKTIDELKNMSREEISAYLKRVKCDTQEIIELLDSIELKARSRASHDELIDFAAIQINSLGIFERMSSK